MIVVDNLFIFTGSSLYFVGATCNFPISILQAFLFGSLISAVDPVAVSTFKS